MPTTKSYAAKSSVIRALKAAKLNPEDYIIDFDGNGKYTAVKKAPQKRSLRSPDTKPRNGNCSAVWAMADSMVGCSRKDVVAACIAAGIPQGTAKTQFQHWFAAKKA